MTGIEVLSRARSVGVEVILKPDLSLSLRYPTGALTAELRDQLIAAKLAIIRVLLIEQGRCQGCGSSDWAVAVLDDDGGRTCAACTTGATPLRRAGVPMGAGPENRSRSGATAVPSWPISGENT